MSPEMRAAVEEMFAETFGMTSAEFDALSIEDKAKIAEANGAAFACSPNIAPRQKHGKPVTEYRAKHWAKPRGAPHD